LAFAATEHDHVGVANGRHFTVLTMNSRKQIDFHVIASNADGKLAPFHAAKFKHVAVRNFRTPNVLVPSECLALAANDCTAVRDACHCHD
jgi:hypothetical protein